MTDVILWTGASTETDVILHTSSSVPKQTPGTIVSGKPDRKTLFYQALVYVPLAVTAADNTVTIDKWQQPLSKAAVPYHRPMNTNVVFPAETPTPSPDAVQILAASTTTGQVNSRTLFYQSKIEPLPQPTAAAVVATIEWVPPLSTMPPSRFVVRPFGQFVPPQVAQVTADEWLPAFGKAVQRGPTETGLYTPFVPKEATLENTVTPDKWLPAWQGPPRYWPQKTTVGYVPIASNLTTTLEWMQPFYKATPPFRLNISDITYPPVAPTVDNTVTIDKWQLSWNLAAKTPRPIHTQPVYGFPYEGVDNSRFEWDWHIQWQGPPRIWPLGKPYQPFVPKEATLENTLGNIAWLQVWQGPPRYQPAKILAQPFVPREATLENTLGHIAWLQPFYKAAPVPPVHATQPFFGYPYEFASNLTTSIEWLQKWQGPPRYTPLKSYPYQPFVPKEATLENTVTPDKWMQRFSIAAPRRLFAKTQLPWSYSPEITVTFGGWHQPLSRAVKPRPVPIVQIGWSYGPAVVDNTVTIEKWRIEWNLASRARKPVHSQPFLGYPQRAPEAFSLTATTSTHPVRKTLFYQAWAFGYPYVDVTIGGPADESERVACVPASSRTVIEPGLLRTATVPLEQRVTTVPELLRVATVPEQERVVNSNDYRDRPCHDT